MAAFGDIAQVQQGDERAGVRLLRFEFIRIAQQDDVLVGRYVERIEQRPGGDIARTDLDPGVVEAGAFLFDALGRPRRVRDDGDL